MIGSEHSDRVEDDEGLHADLHSLRIERDAPLTPRRRWRVGSQFVLVAGVAVLAGLGTWRTLGRALPVNVARVTLSTAGEVGPAPVLSGSGYIVTGDRYVSIGVRVPGRIDHYFVEEGQGVHKGDSLVQLDDRDYRSAVTRTEAGLQVARANASLADAELARGRTLRAQRVISQQELDVLQNKAAVARATIMQLEAELQQARVNLDYTVLRAPSDGVVLAKLKEVGEIAVPGGFAGSGDLIRLANLTDLRAEVDVNEADLNRVHLGQFAQVTPDAYPDARYAAEVVKLYPQVDRQKGTLKIEVRVRQPDGRLLPDMSVRITFLADRPAGRADEPVVLVPAAAVRRDNLGANFVWVVESGSAHRVTVETAGDVDNRVRIASGLKGGETVIVGDPPARDGERVSVMH